MLLRATSWLINQMTLTHQIVAYQLATRPEQPMRRNLPQNAKALSMSTRATARDTLIT